YNGSSWSVMTSPNQGTGDNQLQGVTCVASADCWAAGYSASPNQTLTEHYNGTWSVVTSPDHGTSDIILDGVGGATGADCSAARRCPRATARAARTCCTASPAWPAPTAGRSATTFSTALR